MDRATVGHMAGCATKKCNSVTCKNEKDGYKDEATLENQMGGRIIIWNNTGNCGLEDRA